MNVETEARKSPANCLRSHVQAGAEQSPGASPAWAWRHCSQEIYELKRHFN